MALAALRGVHAVRREDQPQPTASSLADLAQQELGLLVSCCTLATYRLNVPLHTGDAGQIASSMACAAAGCRMRLWPDPPAARAQLAARGWVPAMPPAASPGAAASSGGGSSSGSACATFLAGLLRQHRPDMSAEALRLYCL